MNYEVVTYWWFNMYDKSVWFAHHTQLQTWLIWTITNTMGCKSRLQNHQHARIPKMAKSSNRIYAGKLWQKRAKGNVYGLPVSMTNPNQPIIFRLSVASNKTKLNQLKTRWFLIGSNQPKLSDSQTNYKLELHDQQCQIVFSWNCMTSSAKLYSACIAVCQTMTNWHC